MMQKHLQFLDYAALQENAIVTYRASDMRLAIHSNASYLSEPKACSRAGGHMFMAGNETGFDPSWISLLHLRFYSGNNLCVRRNVPMFYRDLWPACAHPKLPFHLCYQKKAIVPLSPK